MEPMAVRDQLVAADARYAALLGELADLFRLREHLRRELAAAGQSESTPEPPVTLVTPVTPVKPVTPATPVTTARTAATATPTSTPLALHVLSGGAAAGATPALRLAQKQGTRAHLRVVEGGLVAS